MIGLGTGISDVKEFNRRALIALRGVDLLPHDEKNIAQMRKAIDAGAAPSPWQQVMLYRVVDKYKRHISDALATDYAANRLGWHA